MDFDLIYQMYFRDVFLYLCNLCGNESAAEELTQETFVKALKALDSFDGRKDIRAWLFIIARNTYYTDRKRQKFFTGNEPPADAPDPKGDFESRIFDEDTTFRIHRFLHQMKEPYKEVFSLRVFGELPFEKIGLLFGKSASWARVIYYRAKVQIKQYLEANAYE